MSDSTFGRSCCLISLAVLATVTGCGRKGAADDTTKPEAQPEVAAETAIVATQSFAEVVGAIGTVVPRAGHVAMLSAPMTTRVANILVSTGQLVAKGDALVELEQSGFQAGLRSAVAAQTSARAARDRLKRLVDQGITPQRELDQATADLARADADVQVAQRMMDLSVLRSPIAGVVTRMSTSLGASVDPSQPLVEVADPAAVDVLLSVQPSDAARIRAGNRVTLHPGQRAGAEILASGDVVDIAGVVDSTSHSVTVRVRATSTRRELRIGETLFGEVVVATRPNAVMVPLDALVPEGDGFKVFIVDSGNVAHATPVTVGGKTDKLAEVVTGVSAGDRVVTYGAFGVEDGARIIAAAPGGPAKRVTKPDSTEKP